MTDERRPVDQLLDWCLYAPFGLIVTSRETVPVLAEKGREQLIAQVQIAKFLGRMAVQYGKAEAAKRRRPTEREPSPSAAPRPIVVPGPSGVEQDVPVRRATVDDAPPVEELAIPGYDALAASQVVARLDALGPADLDRIERYEAAHRNRRTILGKVAQLRGSS